MHVRLSRAQRRSREWRKQSLKSDCLDIVQAEERRSKGGSIPQLHELPAADRVSAAAAHIKALRDAKAVEMQQECAMKRDRYHIVKSKGFVACERAKPLVQLSHPQPLPWDQPASMLENSRRGQREEEAVLIVDTIGNETFDNLQSPLSPLSRPAPRFSYTLHHPGLDASVLMARMTASGLSRKWKARRDGFGTAEMEAHAAAKRARPIRRHRALHAAPLNLRPLRRRD